MDNILSKLGPALIAKVSGVCLVFLFNIFVTHTLGAKESGLFFLTYTILLGLAILCRYGMDNGLIRYGGIIWQTGDRSQIWGAILYVLKLTLSLSIILGLLIYFSSAALSQSIFNKPELQDSLQAGALVLWPFTLILVLSALYKATDSAATANFIETGASPVFASIFIAVWITLFNTVYAEDFILGFGVAAGLVALFGLYGINRKTSFNNQRYDNTQALLTQGKAMIVVQLVSFVINWSPTIFLGAYESSEQVAYYSVAVRIASLTTFILIAINSVVAPHFSALFEQGKHEELNELATKSALWLMLAALPVTLMFLCFPKFFLGFFGEGFSQGELYLIIVAIGQFVNVSTGSVGYLLTMTGHEKIVRNSTLFVAAISLIMNLTVVRYYGATGAAITTAATLIIQNMIAAVFVARKLNIYTIPGWAQLRKLQGKS